MRGRRLPTPTPGVLVALAVGALLLTGCGEASSRVLGALGVAHIEKVSPEDVPKRRSEGALLVQLDEPSLPAVRNAIRVGADGDLPAAALAAVAGGAPLLVVAPDEDAGLALGARLSRAGAVRVGVVVGEREALATLAAGP
jgi:hypothetical protein